MDHRPIIIIGPGASGKDHLARQLQALGYRRAVPCTTRPMRRGEVDGEDYHFLTLAEFKRRIAADEFLEWFAFGDAHWHYGTAAEEFHGATLVVTNPRGLRRLVSRAAGFLVIYLNIPAEVRRSRLAARADADSVERRLQADADDFRDFNLHHIEITDPDFTVEEILGRIRPHPHPPIPHAKHRPLPLAI